MLVETPVAAMQVKQVADLHQPYHPVILDLIDQLIAAAHKEGGKVSLCGETASEEQKVDKR